MQLTAVGQPVVVEHGPHSLLPLPALVDKRVTQPHLRAQIKQMIGRHPRLRQPTDHQQLPQMLRVRAVALGPLLVPAQRTRRRRLPKMHPSVDATQLNNEPPARRRLKRDLELLAREPGEKPSHALTVRRRDTSPADLTRLGIDPLGRDLRSVLIQSHYDRHLGPPQAPRFERLRGLSALELRRSLLMPSPRDKEKLFIRGDAEMRRCGDAEMRGFWLSRRLTSSIARSFATGSPAPSSGS